MCFKNNHYLCIVKFNSSNMNKIKSTHYLLVTDVIYNDGGNAQLYNFLLWWNLNHCNTMLKLRTVIKNGKSITIMTLVTPEDRTDLVDEFDGLVSNVNGLYPVYDLISVCGGLSIRDDEERNKLSE